MEIRYGLIAAACATMFSVNALAAPYPDKATPAAVDLGATRADSAALVTLTVAVKLRNTDQMHTVLDSVYTPRSPQYHNFLTTDEFARQFGPSAQTVAQLTAHFQAAGFRVEHPTTAHLRLTGSVAAVEAEFGVALHDYRVPSSEAAPGYTFHAPTTGAHLSPQVAGDVEAVLGFSTRPSFRPNLRQSGPLKAAPSLVAATLGSAPPTTDSPGKWTVIDFAEYYDVGPMYSQGYNGIGRTLAIVTLASFTQSDAYGYWSSLHLPVRKNRITEIPVDGGSGPPSDASGSIETTLDVEQSGGLSPGAKMLVYEAPNTEQGFVDAFAQAIDSNQADTMSTSWGEWEWLDTIAIDDVTDPVTNRTTSTLQALNDLLAQAALQGQSVFAAAGDAGAYDANDSASIFPLPQFTKTLSVDDPASQTYITAAGGTTLPGTQTYSLPNGGTYKVNIPTEQAWNWEYLTNLCAILGYNPISCGIFPVGGGGGVSSYVALPTYQKYIPGIVTTPYGQSLRNISGSTLPPGITLPVNLPAGFAGRNVPDLSVNSDPDTGYIVWYTSSTSGFAVEDFYGGTSFAAPQLNGVASLLDDGLHHRIGLLNYPLYNLLRANAAYGVKGAPLRDIRASDNDYWQAGPGYDRATGVGVPNVSNLFEALQGQSF